MTLAELLVAGVITSSSCCASLHVWGHAAQASHAARQTSVAAALLDRHWLATQRWLLFDGVACDLSAHRLDQDVSFALPLADGLERSIEPDGEGDGVGVWLVLRHLDSGLQRRQLFTPSGLGGCASTAELPKELEP